MDPVRSGAIFRLQRTHFAVISSPARSRGGSAVGSPQLAQVKTEEGNRQSPSPSAGAARSPGTRHSNHARFHDLCQTSPISTAVLQRLLAGPKLEPLPKPETEPIRPPQSPLPSSPQPPEAPASAVSLARSGDTAEQLFDAGLPADDDMKMPQPEAPEPAEEEVDFSTEDSDKVTAGPNVKTGLEPSSSGAVPTPATGVAAAMTADAAPAAPADAAAVAAVPVATGDDATASVAEQGAVTLTDWHLLVSVDAGTAEMVVRMGGRCDIAALTTGPVASRVGVREVRAEDGRTYLLKGPLAAASCAPLLPGRVAAAYRDGFPARWRMSLRRVFAASEAAAAVAAAPAPADLISVEDDSTDEAAASKTRELRRKRPRQPPSPSHAPPHRAAWVSSVPSALPPPGPEMSPPEEADESVDDEVAPAPPPPPPAAPSSHRPAVAVPPAAVAATAAGPPVESPPRAAARPSASAARRSARKSMPVLDWWRNQRLREDAGEEGGPAVVPGSTEDAPSAAPASAPAVAPRRKRQDLSKPRDKSAAAATATAGATRAAAAPLAAAAAAASAAATGAGGKAAAAAATTAGATKTRGKAARISFLELETPVWGEDEVQALFHAHMVVEPTAPDFWERVAKRMGTRTATDCQERWFERFEKPPPAAHKKTGGRGSGSGGGGGGGSSGGGGGGGKRPRAAMADSDDEEEEAWEGVEAGKACQKQQQKKPAAGEGSASGKAAVGAAAAAETADAFEFDEDGGGDGAATAATAVAATAAARKLRAAAGGGSGARPTKAYLKSLSKNLRPAKPSKQSRHGAGAAATATTIMAKKRAAVSTAARARKVSATCQAGRYGSSVLAGSVSPGGTARVAEDLDDSDAEDAEAGCSDDDSSVSTILED